MSVQRWKPNKATERYWSEGMRFDADGAYVAYADHVAALAEAEQRVRDEVFNGHRHYYQQVWNDALGKAREAVIAECIAHHGYTPGQTCPYCTDAIAAIDALAARRAPEEEK